MENHLCPKSTLKQVVQEMPVKTAQSRHSSPTRRKDEPRGRASSVSRPQTISKGHIHTHTHTNTHTHTHTYTHTRSCPHMAKGHLPTENNGPSHIGTLLPW